jgi:hypothetical protein
MYNKIDIIFKLIKFIIMNFLFFEFFKDSFILQINIFIIIIYF